jgi:hypothetical protein
MVKNALVCSVNFNDGDCIFAAMSINRFFIPFLLFLVFNCSTHSALAQDLSRRQFPGTKITILLPSDFEHAGRYNGFQGDSGKVSVMISSVPTSLELNLKAFTPESVKKQGGELVQVEDVTLSGIKSKLIEIRQPMKQGEYRKFVTLLGDTGGANVISGFVPADDAKAVAAMKSMMLSVQYDAKMADNFWEGVSFTLDTKSSGFTPEKYSAGGLIFSRGEKYKKDQPMLVAASSVRKINVKDTRESCLKRLNSLPGLDSIEVKSIQPIEIDKMQGYEIEAYALDDKKDKVLIYQAMIFNGTEQYYLVVGTAAASFSEYLSLYKSIALSLKRK